jgi:hypothetical protein
MSIFKIPLTNTPQRFEISLAGINYIMTVKFNSAFGGGWVMDLQNGVTTDYLVADIPFVTGVNLLSGLNYLGIDGQLFIYTDGDENAVPTFDNLGVESNLYFRTDAPNG